LGAQARLARDGLHHGAPSAKGGRWIAQANTGPRARLPGNNLQ